MTKTKGSSLLIMMIPTSMMAEILRMSVRKSINMLPTSVSWVYKEDLDGEHNLKITWRTLAPKFNI